MKQFKNGFERIISFRFFPNRSVFIEFGVLADGKWSYADINPYDQKSENKFQRLFFDGGEEPVFLALEEQFVKEFGEPEQNKLNLIHIEKQAKDLT